VTGRGTKTESWRPKGFFKDGLKHGHSTVWHDNGTKSEDMYWRNGKKHGPCKQWYENGQLEKECCYFDGKVRGEQKRWRASGVRMPANVSDSYLGGYEAAVKVGGNIAADVHRGAFEVAVYYRQVARDTYQQYRQHYLKFQTLYQQCDNVGRDNVRPGMEWAEGLCDGLKMRCWRRAFRLNSTRRETTSHQSASKIGWLRGSVSEEPGLLGWLSRHS